MLGGPIAVGWLWAGLFLAVSAYCLTRVVAGLRNRVAPSCAGHAFGPDVDLAHIVMGVGMAAMFSPLGDHVPRLVWVVPFALTAGWFAVRMLRDWPRLRHAGSRERAWHWHHLVDPLAMVYMAAVMPTGSTAMAGMADMAASSAAANPLTTTVDLGFLGYFALFVVWSAGAVVRVPARAQLVPAGAGGALGSVLLSPRAGVSCQTLIGIGMAYAFVVML